MASSSTRPTRQAGTLQGILLLLPVTLSTMGIVLLSPILPQLGQHFAGAPHSALLVQLVLTIPALCLALFSTPAGWIVDRVGRRRILLVAMVIYALVGVAPVFLNNLTAILFTRVCVGLTEAIILVSTTTLIGDYFHGHERDKWLAFQTAVASVAAVLLYAVAGALGGAYGWRGPFWVYASSLVLLVGLLFFTWEPATDSTPELHLAAERGILKFPYKRVLGICLVTIFASLGFFLAQIELAGALVEKQVYDPALIGIMTAGIALAVPVGSVIFRYVMTRYSVVTQLFVSFLLMGGGLVLAGKAPSVPLLLTGAGINMLGGGIALPTVLTWTMRQLPFELRGRGIGMWTAAFEIGQFLSSMVAAVVAPALGGLLPAFAAVGVVCVIVAVLALIAGLWLGGRPVSART